MALTSQLTSIWRDIEKRQERGQLTNKEKALLSELIQLSRRLTQNQIDEARDHVIKMTGPGDNVCGCCGRPY